MSTKTASQPARRGRRCRPLRIENDDTPWFVSSRTIEERFWLHPLFTSALLPRNADANRRCRRLQAKTDRRLEKVVARANRMRGPLQPLLTVEDAKRIIRGLIGSALARAQKKYKTLIFALIVMSDHLHLVLQTRGKNLAGFMGYVKARIAEAINLVTGKRGPLWSRRYDAQPILDDSACSDRLAYCLDNPVMAGLVDSADSWPGISLAYGMGETDEIEFEYLDRTAWHRKGRPESLAPFFRKAILKLSPLPAMAGQPRELVRQTVNALLGRRGKTGESGQRDTRPALGVEAVINTAFEQQPRQPKRSRRPYAFGSKQARQQYYQSASLVLDAYARQSERFRSGRYNVSFPPGTYRPPGAMAA